MALKPYNPSEAIISITDNSLSIRSKQRMRYDDRLSDTERGYGWTWSKIRKAHIGKHPYCARCGKLCDVGKQDSIVDHIIPVVVDPTKARDMSNLQTLCRQCHAIKTARDIEKYPHYKKHISI